MARNAERMDDDNLRRIFGELRSSIAAGAKSLLSLTGRVVTLEEATATTTLTDSVPRVVKYTADYTLLTSAAALSVTISLDSLPAGVRWTHVWIEPVDLFDSGGSIWSAQVVVPVTGATAGGAPKTVDVTSPDALANQSASWFVQCDNSAPVTLELTVSNGADTSDLLTAGSVNVYLTLSVPGSSANDLPPS